MSDYFLAPALVQLRTETDKAFPKRDHASDGWIGDAAHAARPSDHNPCWACTGRSHGIVRALDLDINPDGNPDRDLVKALLEATIGDPRVWYVIHDGKIYSRTFGWSARVYTGLSPHHEHVHVSLNGANGIPGDPGNFDTRPWGVAGDHGPKDGQLPRVSLADVRQASRHRHEVVHPIQVRRIQHALNQLVGAGLDADGVYGPRTRVAYRTWQQRLGYTGNAADGIPGQTSLTRLGARRFRVTR